MPKGAGPRKVAARAGEKPRTCAGTPRRRGRAEPGRRDASSSSRGGTTWAQPARVASDPLLSRGPRPSRGRDGPDHFEHADLEARAFRVSFRHEQGAVEPATRSSRYGPVRQSGTFLPRTPTALSERRSDDAAGQFDVRLQNGRGDASVDATIARPRPTRHAGGAHPVRDRRPGSPSRARARGTEGSGSRTARPVKARSPLLFG